MKTLFALTAAALLLIYPETALNAALSAAHGWYTSVAPALFPFMTLMPLLTCPDSIRTWERLLGRLMRPLLNLPGAAAPAIVIALTAGSPAGAHAAVRICSEARMSRAQLERLIGCTCGFSPAFLITGVGVSMLGSASDGMLLLRAQILSQLTLLFLTRHTRPDLPLPPVPESTQPEPIRSAVLNVLAVCGYMIVFAVAAAILARLLRSPDVGLAALCLLDAPSAARSIASLPLSREVKLLSISAVTASGGLCAAVQNLAACKNTGVRPAKYAVSRLLHTLLTTAFTAIQLHKTILSTAFFARPMEFSALTAAFLSVPVLIFWKKDPFLNRRNFEKASQKAPQKHEKAQHNVHN